MFGCTWKIEFSGFAFHFIIKRSLWPGNYFTFLFSLQTIFGPSFKRVKRERERNGEQEQTELQSDDHKLSSSPTTHTALTAPVSSITASRRSSKDWLQRHAISPSPPPRDLASRSNPVASLSSFSQFDRIWWIFFFLGFVSFGFMDWEMILYICLEAKKMWATSRKCVFYSIFKNTTKH